MYAVGATATRLLDPGMTASGEAADPAAVESTRLEYDDGHTRSLFGIFFANLGLMIVSLLMYRFWALTRVRRFIWARTRLLGDPFAYRGTGMEIFVGFLKVTVLVLLPLAVVLGGLTFWASSAARGYLGAVNLVGVIALFWLISLGRYLSLRYRANRTTWRAIRGRASGNAVTYATWALFYQGLVVVTAGLALPWADVGLMRLRLAHLSIGGRAIRFEGAGSELFSRYLVCWLLLPLTFGLSIFWYRAGFWRYVADRARFGEARIAFNAAGGAFAQLFLGNVALLVLSAGLLLPLVWQRKVRFLCRHLVLIGPLAPEALTQSAEDAATGGEGLAGDFTIA